MVVGIQRKTTKLQYKVALDQATHEANIERFRVSNFGFSLQFCFVGVTGYFFGTLIKFKPQYAFIGPPPDIVLAFIT